MIKKLGIGKFLEPTKEMKKIKIKNYEYEIKEVEKEEKGFKTEDNDLRLYGQTNYEEQVIKIYKNLPYQRKRDTLIHELTHAFHDVYLASQHVKDKFDEEDICCFMASYSEDILNIVNEYFKEIKNDNTTKNE